MIGYPSGTTRRVPQETFSWKPCDKSFIDQSCLVKLPGYWPCSFFANILGQYSAVLTLSLANNPYILGFLFVRSAFWLESVCRVMSSYRGVFQIQSRLWKDLSKLCLWHDHDHQFSLAFANFLKALFLFLSYDSQNCAVYSVLLHGLTQGPHWENIALRFK